jgi:hypothetical protein
VRLPLLQRHRINMDALPLFSDSASILAMGFLIFL